jgi:hypothetical protein
MATLINNVYLSLSELKRGLFLKRERDLLCIQQPVINVDYFITNAQLCSLETAANLISLIKMLSSISIAFNIGKLFQLKFNFALCNASVEKQ